MRIWLGILAFAFTIVSALSGGQAAGGDEALQIPLRVPAGAPLRLYLTKRVSKRMGAPVEGKILEPVFAFDRVVVPAGSAVTGYVNRIQPVTKWLRFRAILNGDFTPLHSAQMEFDTLTLPDGSKLPLHTVETAGLNSIYVEPSKKKNQKPQPANQNGGILGT